jgi:hypothetical protein
MYPNSLNAAAGQGDPPPGAPAASDVPSRSGWLNFADAPEPSELSDRLWNSGGSHTRRTFQEVNDLLRRSSEALCRELLPGGRKNGMEWVAGDLSGARGRSLSVNLKEGVWKDFGSGEGGADLINLIAATQHIGQGEALRWAEDWLGLAPSASPRDIAPKMRIVPPPAASNDDVPDLDAEEPYREPVDEYTEANWHRWVAPDKRWQYVSEHGELFCEVWRWEAATGPTGKKLVRPYNPYTTEFGIPEAEEERKRPLYNLPKIVQSRAAEPVVVVEGEKTADALAEIDCLATTCIGGSQAAGKADWSPLYGRHVVYWRDNDHGGKQHREKLLDILKEVGAASIREVKIPKGKPAKWDAADATPEERRALVEEAKRGPASTSASALPFLIEEWLSTTAYVGEPEPIDWLVTNVIPAGDAGMVASIGGLGKSYTLLDLAARVAWGARPLDPPILGGHVVKQGNVVVITAEDNKKRVHRRLKALDPDGSRQRAAPHRLYVVPLPSTGGPFSIITGDKSGFTRTAAWGNFRAQLRAIPELALVVLDPLQTFAGVDLNSDPMAGQAVCSMLCTLAAETGATVIVTHHMRKPSEQGKRRKPTEEDEIQAAREAVRGTSALVDGLRFVVALWAAGETEAREVAQALGAAHRRGQVAKGAVVKTNEDTRATAWRLVRDGNGLLMDREDDLARLRKPDDDLLDVLVAAVAEAAELGQAYAQTVHAKSGLYGRRCELPGQLAELGKTRLEKLVDQALTEKRLVLALVSGREGRCLDVPGGPCARGVGTIARGAMTGKPGRKPAAAAP